jgi:hypothetical protein
MARTPKTTTAGLSENSHEIPVEKPREFVENRLAFPQVTTSSEILMNCSLTRPS